MDNNEAALTARRRVLAAGFAGMATSLLPWLDRRAGASGSTPGTEPGGTTGDPFGPDTTNASDITTGGTDSEAEPTNPSDDTQAPTGNTAEGTTDDTAAVTTTTAPPRKPTEADIELLDFAQTVELTIRDLYDSAIRSGVFEGALLDDFTAIREAHEGYGTSVGGLLGTAAGNTASDILFARMETNFRGDAKAILAAAAAIEDTAVATHLDIIDQLVGVDGAALIASIIVIEARHATLFKVLAGITDLLATDGVALSPSE